MSRLPDTPQAFRRIFLNSLRCYFPVLKKTFFLIVLITVVFNVYVYFKLVPHYRALHYIIAVIVILLLIYLWALLLQLANACLRQHPLSLSAAFVNCFKRLFSIYLSIIYYAILILIILALANLLIWLATKLWGHDLKAAALVFAFLVGAPLLYILVLTYFAFPLVVMEERETQQKWQLKKFFLSVLLAFRDAALITGKQWFQAFGVYVVSVVILMLVWPHTEIGQFMQRYYLAIVYDFIVFLILLPIQANLIIFTLHDLQLRRHSGEQ